MTNEKSFTKYEETLDCLKKNKIEIEKQQEILRDQLQSLSSIARVLVNLENFMERGWHLHILEVLEKNKGLLAEDKINNSSIIKFLEEIKKIATETRKNTKPHLFPRNLQEACQKADIKIDSNSSHPIYKFNQGFFEIKVDDGKKRIYLSNYESSKIIDFPADIPAVLHYLQQEQKRIFGRSFNGKTFLKKLRTEYLAIIKKNKLTDGSSILIRSIIENLKKKDKNLTSDEFLVDLSKLVREGHGEINDRRFELQQTKDMKEGMLLHGTLSPTYVGFIIFKKV